MLLAKDGQQRMHVNFFVWNKIAQTNPNQWPNIAPPSDRSSCQTMIGPTIRQVVKEDYAVWSRFTPKFQSKNVNPGHKSS
jgi:hypothetical protein